MNDIIERNRCYFRAENAMHSDPFISDIEIRELISNLLGTRSPPIYYHPRVGDLISKLLDLSEAVNRSLRLYAQTQFKVVYDFLLTIMARIPEGYDRCALALLIGETLSTYESLSESTEQKEERIIKVLAFFLIAKNSKDEKIVNTASTLFNRYMQFMLKQFDGLSLQALFDQDKDNFLRIIFRIIPTLLQFFPKRKSDAKVKDIFYPKEVNIHDFDSVMESLSERKGCKILFNHLLVYFTRIPAISDNPNRFMNKKKEDLQEFPGTPAKIAHIVDPNPTIT